jgi:hypothetical protein
VPDANLLGVDVLDVELDAYDGARMDRTGRGVEARDGAFHPEILLSSRRRGTTRAS